MARGIIALVTSLISRVIDHHKVFTGAAPFKNSSPTTVGVRILSGIRPNRPAHPSFTDELWDLSRDCWHQKPSLRPGILKVVSRLRNALIVQDDHADGTDVSTTSTACKAVSSNQRRKPSHRMPSFFILSRGVSQDSKAYDGSQLTRRLHVCS